MKIPVSVIGAHVLIIFLALYFQSPPKKCLRTPVIVRTHIDTLSAAHGANFSQKAASQKPAQSSTKKVVQKPTPQLTAKKEAPKKSEPNQKLISILQQSLNTLNTTADPVHNNLKARSVGTLASESLNFETHYEDALINYLETHLSLPEPSDVKLKLTLNREGHIQNIEIVDAASEKNKKYVEATLLCHRLPPFSKHVKGDTHTFTITLTTK